MFLHVSPIIELVTSLMPDAQTIQIFGLILQFLGEGLICYGIICAISDKVIANAEYSRQILIASAFRNTKEQSAQLEALRKSIDEQVSQLNAKLNQIQSQETSAKLFKKQPRCRFCDAKIEQESFCPSCGKAN